MADPHHVPVLDGFDELTVRLYRAGLTIAAAGVATMAIDHLLAALAADARPLWLELVGPLLAFAGGAAAVANMHLYDKRIRWLINASGWTGAVLLVVGLSLGTPVAGFWLWHAGLGFLFVSLSAFALKEQFCFRIPLLRLVPAFLALALVPMLLRIPLFSGLLLLGAALPYAALAVAKHRMPLHFDIGNKDAYQI